MPWGLIDNINIWMSNKISLKYVPWSLIDNMSALVQIMAWRHPGDKPLSEPVHRRIYAALGGDELTAIGISQERILVTNQVLMDEITWHAVFKRVAAGSICSNMAGHHTGQVITSM